MTFRDFLYAADALRLEGGVGFDVPSVGVQSAPVPSPADMRQQNAQAFAALTGIMAGVKKR